MMTAEEIRQGAIVFVRLLENKEPSVKTFMLIAQSLVVAVYEVAAQIAEFNEREAETRCR